MIIHSFINYLTCRDNHSIKAGIDFSILFISYNSSGLKTAVSQLQADDDGQFISGLYRLVIFLQPLIPLNIPLLVRPHPTPISCNSIFEKRLFCCRFLRFVFLLVTKEVICRFCP